MRNNIPDSRLQSPCPTFFHGKKKVAVAVLLALTGLQDATAQEGGALEEVVITGSRIRVTSGMETPSPVTVVTREEIDIISPTTLIEGLAELPQFYGSSTTQNPGSYFNTSGAGTLNLRGLQGNRTLQLLDGRRVVQSTIFGGPDINLFPENVIRSVETVTGGATSAYGTDAVAGVVNFVLDTNFEGFRARVQGGATEKGHNQNYEVTFGAGFKIGENTRVLLSAEKAEQDPIWGEDILDYDWYRARGLIENPDPAAGTSPDNPWFLAVDNIRSFNYDGNGLFHFPAAAGGTLILDSQGNTSPYVRGEPCNAHGCSGGSGTDTGINRSQITPESGRENYFAYLEHEFADNFSVYGQVIFGEAGFVQKGNTGLFGNPPGTAQDRAFTVYSGNPFLPPEVQQIMTDRGIASVPFSRIGHPLDLGRNAYTAQFTETLSATGGFEYEFNDGFLGGWQARGYYQVGNTDVNAAQRGGIRLDRVYIAADVVTNPQTGQPACNVTVVSGLYPDCVPLNLFGAGRASEAALDWVLDFEPGVPMVANGFLTATESIPHSYVSREFKYKLTDIEQDVWEISADGQLHEGLGAGPITMALGYGYREESFVQLVEVGPGGNVDVDPSYRPVMANNPALGIRGVPGGNAASGNSVELQFSNVPFARGEQDVSEAFVEFFVPLLADRPLVRQLNFSAATRWAEYSGAGEVWSWKGGFDWTLTDELRLRSTVSQDVRAATMGEKFDRTGGVQNVTDYGIDPGGGLSYIVTIYSNGTPDIQPEEAKTITMGGVYQPDWLEGLSFSTDWYSVEVKDNINQTNAAGVVSGCYQDNDVDLCRFITRTGAPSIEDPTQNYISLVGVPYFNQNAVKAMGVDFETQYRRDVDWFGGGESIGLRLLGSYLRERSNINSAGVKTDITGRLGTPEWTAVLSGNYRRGPLAIAITGRYTHDMMVNANWNFNGNSTRWDVADNEINKVVLFDTRIAYDFELERGELNVFLNINNLFDKQPQDLLTAAFSSNFSAGTGPAVTGDDRGRRYVLGASYNY